jgi:hypothetical protein
MTDAHHDAAQHHNGSSREPVLFCTQKSSNYNIPARFKLSVCFDNYSASQIVKEEGLVSLSEPKFPRKTGMVDASLG